MDITISQTEIINWLTGPGLTILLILVGAVIISKLSKTGIERLIRRAISERGIDPMAEKKREDTLIKVFSGALTILIYLVACMLILSEFNVDIGPLIAGAGIAGVAFGFGAQYLVRDIITGFFLILENQFRVGDVIEVAGVSGTVENITLRVTVLRDLDGILHFVPNGEMKVVSNETKDFARINMVIGVSYGDDIDKAAEIINKVGQDLAEDQKWKDSILEAPVFLRVDKLNDSSVDLRVLGKVRPQDRWAVAGEFRKRIKIAFDKNGVEIPFPQRVVINKG